MKVLSLPALHGRDFGSSLLAVEDLKEWLKANRLRLFTDPPIDEYDFVQVEYLFLAIERAAGNVSDEEAEKIVSADAFLAADDAASFAQKWLVGAEAARKWRTRITYAMTQGELPALDFGSKLPIPVPQAAVEALAQFGPTVDDLAKGIYARSPGRPDVSIDAPIIDAEKLPEGEAGLTKRERQIVAIIEAAIAAGYNPMSIPLGGKGTLKDACKESRSDLFGYGDDPFKDAWQVAVTQNRIRTANHDQYRGK